jgi:hypothetical protein
LALFGIFGKKKQQIDKMPVPTGQNNAFSAGGFGVQDPIMPVPPSADDDVPTPTLKSRLPDLSSKNQQNIDIPDIKIEQDIDEPTDSSLEKDDVALPTFSSEEIRKDDVNLDDFNLDADFSPESPDTVKNQELDDLKKAVNAPANQNVPIAGTRGYNQEQSAKNNLPFQSEENQAQPIDQESELESDDASVDTENMPDFFGQNNEEETERPTAADFDNSNGENEEDEESRQEVEIPDFFGPDSGREQQIIKDKIDLPAFGNIATGVTKGLQNIPTKQNQFLPSFEVRETKSKEQLYIDARDYEKLLREINSIDIVAKRTSKELMKLKDVSGNENKLLEKYHADLTYINEKLAYIDTVLFEP